MIDNRDVEMFEEIEFEELSIQKVDSETIDPKPLVELVQLSANKLRRLKLDRVWCVAVLPIQQSVESAE